MTRSVLYVTGTRADFGLMAPTLRAIAAHPELSVEICVTGMHLSDRFGSTVKEVEASGLPVASRVPVDIDDDTPQGMARSAAQMMAGIVSTMAETRPDFLLLLGDRPEMLVSALAGTLMGIPVVHLCGGERSGTVDDAIRHAISKLAHVHMVATDGARERVLRMGEEPWRVHVVGAPGLVGLLSLATRGRDDLASQFNLDPSRPLALSLFHPVVQDAEDAGRQCALVLSALAAEGFQSVCLMPNADAGSSRIREEVLRHCDSTPGFRAVTHLGRNDFASFLATADLLIGNSSSGIVESATFGIPVVNVGDRQKDRERNANTFDAQLDPEDLRKAIHYAMARGRTPTPNVYTGSGATDKDVANLLANIKVDAALLKKDNIY